MEETYGCICLCSERDTRINCETDIDQCESMPCVNGSCSNNVSSYSCECHLLGSKELTVRRK